MWVNQSQLAAQRRARQPLGFHLAPRRCQLHRCCRAQDFRIVAIGDDHPAPPRLEAWSFDTGAVKVRSQAPVKPVTIVKVFGPFGIPKQISACHLDLDNDQLPVGVDPHQIGTAAKRIPERGDDVIATLARSFNGMADSLQNQIVRLATLSQVQQRFVSDVSHELRTPLTTIRLAGEVLYDQRDAFPPATARTAELLRTQVQRFEILLSDLLEMSRYDAGAVEVDPEPTNLVRLVEDAVESVASLAATKGSELRVVAPGGYFEAEVEARRIRRILQNLLGNAIDHGEGKPIIVYIDSDETAVALAVRDYGIGMSPAAMERVFDRFWRADPSRQRTTGGTGLGLAISLEDAALHGGWLEVWSAPDQGSCFRLTLPRTVGGVLKSSPLELPPEDDGHDDGNADG